MKGFKVNYKGETYDMCLEDENGTFSVILTHVGRRNETSFNLGGLDTNNAVHWLNVDNISIGDRIEIQFLELEASSDPVSVRPLLEKRDDQYALKKKLAAYERLKKELEEGGHI